MQGLALTMDMANESKTFTYGVLPLFEAFEAAFDAACPDGSFSVSNDPYMGNAEFTCSKLYDKLQACVDEYHDDECDEGDDAGNFASDVMSHLGFEWV